MNLHAHQIAAATPAKPMMTHASALSVASGHARSVTVPSAHTTLAAMQPATMKNRLTARKPPMSRIQRMPGV